MASESSATATEWGQLPKPGLSFFVRVYSRLGGHRRLRACPTRRQRRNHRRMGCHESSRAAEILRFCSTKTVFRVDFYVTIHKW